MNRIFFIAVAAAFSSLALACVGGPPGSFGTETSTDTTLGREEALLNVPARTAELVKQGPGSKTARDEHMRMMANPGDRPLVGSDAPGLSGAGTGNKPLSVHHDEANEADDVVSESVDQE